MSNSESVTVFNHKETVLPSESKLPLINLLNKENFDRDKYYKPGTNRTTKEAKEIFKSNFEIFSNQSMFSELDHQKKLELSRNYFNDLINQGAYDTDFLKSMKRSFAARIGRQKMLSNRENNSNNEIKSTAQNLSDINL